MSPRHVAGVHGGGNEQKKGETLGPSEFHPTAAQSAITGWMEPIRWIIRTWYVAWYVCESSIGSNRKWVPGPRRWPRLSPNPNFFFFVLFCLVFFPLSSNYIPFGHDSQLNDRRYFDIHNYTPAHKVPFHVQRAFHYTLIVRDEIRRSAGLDRLRGHLIE